MTGTNLDAQAVGVKEKKRRSQAYRNMQTFLRNRLAGAGLIVVVLFTLASIFAPLITPYDPALPDMKQIGKAPSAEHPFGTD